MTSAVGDTNVQLLMGQMVLMIAKLNMQLKKHESLPCTVFQSQNKTEITVSTALFEIVC